MLRYHTDGVGIEASDKGNGTAPNVVTGHGIVGMRERVAALGGTFTAGPAAGGFTVTALLPVKS